MDSNIPSVQPVHSPSPRTAPLRWRVVDIVVASVIGVVSAFIYWGGAWAYQALKPAFAFIPGLIGLVNGLFLFAGPLAAIIVRKPGAAVYAEMVAALLESLLGNAWGGAETVISGLLQGIGAELVFLFCLYRVWNWFTAVLSGLSTAAACYIGYAVLGYLQGSSAVKKAVEGASTIVSGAVIAGICMWLLYLAIAKTGALDRFPSGQAVRMKVQDGQDNVSAAEAE